MARCDQVSYCTYTSGIVTYRMVTTQRHLRYGRYLWLDVARCDQGHLWLDVTRLVTVLILQEL